MLDSLSIIPEGNGSVVDFQVSIACELSQLCRVLPLSAVKCC